MTIPNAVIINDLNLTNCNTKYNFIFFTQHHLQMAYDTIYVKCGRPKEKYTELVNPN